MILVLYNDKLYTIVFDYGDGWVKIRELNGYAMEVVEKDKLEVVFKREGTEL